MFNQYTEPVTGPGDVFMASMEEASVKRVLINEESPLDCYNYQSTRQVILEKELPSNGPRSRVGQTECTEEMPVPPHLQPLFEKAAAKWSKAECKAIKQLLNSLKDVFSKDEFEFDLAKEHLVKNYIDPGNAAPVKLTPRCIPLAFADED